MIISLQSEGWGPKDGPANSKLASPTEVLWFCAS